MTADTPRKPSRIRERVESALKAKHHAESMRRNADQVGVGDPPGARLMRDDAAKLEVKAEADLSRWAYTIAPVKVGNGGELRPLPEPGTSHLAEHVAEPPDMLAHTASTQRMELAAGADALALALDTANSIKARDERMLAAQLAAAHKLSMKLMAQAEQQLLAVDGGSSRYAEHSVEAARLAHAAGRMMAAFSEAALTIQRRRTGGKQVVQVIHQQVAVGEGGNAIVAGTVKGRGKTRGRRGPK